MQDTRHRHALPGPSIALLVLVAALFVASPVYAVVTTNGYTDTIPSQRQTVDAQTLDTFPAASYVTYPTNYPFNYIQKQDYQLSGTSLFDFRFLSRYIPNGKPNVLEEGVCIDGRCECKIKWGLHRFQDLVLPRDYALARMTFRTPSERNQRRYGPHVVCGYDSWPPNPYPAGTKPGSSISTQGVARVESRYGTNYTSFVASDYLGDLIREGLQGRLGQQPLTYQQFYEGARGQTFFYGEPSYYYLQEQPLNPTYNVYSGSSAYGGAARPVTGNPRGYDSQGPAYRGNLYSGGY